MLPAPPFSNLETHTLHLLKLFIFSRKIPLTEYTPGQPWPALDPDQLEKSIKEEYEPGNKVMTWILFVLGMSRTERQRTLYNAARPFAVLGGVSDDEVRLLFEANGPYAKVRVTFYVVGVSEHRRF